MLSSESIKRSVGGFKSPVIDSIVTGIAARATSDCIVVYCRREGRSYELSSEVEDLTSGGQSKWAIGVQLTCYRRQV